ncbi:BrnT family toxin [Candidatus Gottesmanbacteria bacterium]|nr:BrnT family toxin [Candidatus Gottesmanbacteria bacterium]
MEPGEGDIKPLEFEWNEFNREKNWLKHKVDYRECEDVFLYKKLKIYPDKKHSKKEVRYLGLGTTFKGRKLTIIFTLRDAKIRIISARDMSRKERSKYEER